MVQSVGVLVVLAAGVWMEARTVAWVYTTTTRVGLKSGSTGRTPTVEWRQRAKKTVFIDGEAGTTGLQVRERLARHEEIEVVSLDASKRKETEARREALNSVDAAVLCLPDAAAIEAVSLISNDAVKVVDASTAHRVNPDWVYGFSEMCAGQRSKIEAATRVANPGCYATGFISLARPLVDAGILTPESKLACSAVSGYSGGGKALYEIHAQPDVEPWGAYGLNLDHKHLPEMALHSNLQHPPVFSPAVGHFEQGMVVSILLPDAPASGEAIHAALRDHYAGSDFVSVNPLGVDAVADAGLLNRGAFLDPTVLNNSNNLDIFVFFSPKHNSALLAARLDNLGKGASGAAVQNLNIMLGLHEHAGLNLD